MAAEETGIEEKPFVAHVNAERYSSSNCRWYSRMEQRQLDHRLAVQDDGPVSSTGNMARQFGFSTKACRRCDASAWAFHPVHAVHQLVGGRVVGGIGGSRDHPD